MVWRATISTRTDTLLPYTTLFRSVAEGAGAVDDALPDAARDEDGDGAGPVEGHDLFGEGEFGAHALDGAERSEEHTSELQSLICISYACFCLIQKIRITNT